MRPLNLAVNTSDVYWTDFQSGLHRIPIGGGTATQIGGSDYAAVVVLDETSVYWTSKHGVWRASLMGESVAILAPADCNGTDGPCNSFWGIAVNSKAVYWANGWPQGVASMPIGGGSPVVLAKGAIPYALVADATSVYWTDNAKGLIQKLDLKGGNTINIASSGAAFYIAADSDNVYWTNGGSVMKSSKVGGAPVALATGQTMSAGIAVDDANVYWTDHEENLVMKVPIGGGSPTVLATDQEGAYGIAVDDTAVYWTTNCAVMKLLK